MLQISKIGSTAEIELESKKDLLPENFLGGMSAIWLIFTQPYGANRGSSLDCLTCDSKNIASILRS